MGTCGKWEEQAVLLPYLIKMMIMNWAKSPTQAMRVAVNVM
jgi:hypothetical protein